MRSFWKILLITIPAVGGYWLYKKSSSPPADSEVKSEQTKENKATSEFPPEREPAAKKGGVGPDEQIIERLTEFDGVTSRVAENLVEKGIYTKEDLTKLSREELMEIKGIGPKRAEKILKL